MAWKRKTCIIRNQQLKVNQEPITPLTAGVHDEGVVLNPFDLAEELLGALVGAAADALRQAGEANGIHKVLLVRLREDLLRRTELVGLGKEKERENHERGLRIRRTAKRASCGGSFYRWQTSLPQPRARIFPTHIFPYKRACIGVYVLDIQV